MVSAANFMTVIIIFWVVYKTFSLAAVFRNPSLCFSIDVFLHFPVSSRVRPILYLILSAAAVPIPIPEMTTHSSGICTIFTQLVGLHSATSTADSFLEWEIIGWVCQACLQSCKSIEISKLYWHRYWNKYLPIPIPTDSGEYRPIANTSIGLTLISSWIELGKVQSSYS